MFYTYIIQSETTGKYYIGSTQDLEARINTHNDPLSPAYKSTKRMKGPWKLVYSEKYSTRSEAIIREREIKSWKSHRTISEFIESKTGRVPASRD